MLLLLIPLRTAVRRVRSFSTKPPQYVYTWGDGYLGTLGHGDFEGRAVPTRLDTPELEGLEPLRVSAGW